jgi:hypothetical protein
MTMAVAAATRPAQPRASRCRPERNMGPDLQAWP